MSISLIFEVETMRQKVVFIGLGKMGSAMAEKILKAGFSLTVYNRTKEKTKPLEALGAQVANSLEQAVQGADVIFTSVIDDAALISITEIILTKLKKGAIHISTSTILPKTAKQLEQQHIDASCVYVAAPVLGVPAAVRAKTAMTLCAGDKDSIDKVTPLFESYSSSIENLGEIVSHANVLKICLNYSLISALELISELYAFAEKSGLDTGVVQESLKHIYAHPGIKLYIDKIHDRQFDDVNFDMRGGNKDVHLFQQAFLDVGVIPDIANMVSGKFTEALSHDMDHKDWSAISEIVRHRSGLK